MSTESFGMDCHICGVSVDFDPEDGEIMPEGWGFVLVGGRCADGRPGLEPMYACSNCKDPDA